MTNGEKLSSGLEKNSKKLEKGTTKNDLVVDCISRAEVQRAIEDVLQGDNCDYDLVEFLADLKDIPSVTPIRPKEHWIDTNVHHYYNDGDIETTELRCSCCNEVVEWDIELLHKPYFCENCGAKMEEVEE